MPLTDRELWILNFFRNSELHGALLMGRLARVPQTPELLKNITRHCATEAHHAALLTELIAGLGGAVDPSVRTVQEHYSREGGVPTELVDILVLSQTLEHRVLVTYRQQLDAPGLNPRIREVLEEILREEKSTAAVKSAGWNRLCGGFPRSRSGSQGGNGVRSIAESPPISRRAWTTCFLWRLSDEGHPSSHS